MTINTFYLKGNSEGYAYSIEAEITYETDNTYIASDQSGKRIVITCKYSANVSSQTAQCVFAGGNVRLIGLAGRIIIANSERTLLIPWTSLTGSSKQFRLEIPISLSDVTWIEDARNGEELNGYIHLNGTVSVKSKITVPFTFETVDKQKISIPWHQEEHQGIVTENRQFFRIEREKWVQILATIGMGSYIVELPLINLKKRTGDWRKVLELFNKATSDFRIGEFEDTIGECRKVVEGIVTVIGSAWRLQHDPRHSFEQKTQSTFSRLRNLWPDNSHSRIDAIERLINSIWDWSGPYHHFEGAVTFRQEASFVLHLTANLIELSAWILEYNPY